MNVPMLVNVTPGPVEGLCPDAHTVAFTWNQPTPIQECIAGYTLETTTSAVQTETVTSTSVDVTVRSGECCVNHIFTVTPVYTQAGQSITSVPVSLVPGENEYPEPGDLRLDVLYDTSTIQVTVCWENVSLLPEFPRHNITTRLNDSSNTLNESGSAASSDMFDLDYPNLIDRSVPVSVSFMTDDCTSSSNRSVTWKWAYTVPPIISGEPTVNPVDLNATFTITFAPIEPLPGVTHRVVSTAVVEVEVTALGSTVQFQNTTDFPDNSRTTQILVTNLEYDTNYMYTVRVLTSSASNATEIPMRFTGTFRSAAPPEGDSVGDSVAPAVGGVVGGVVVLAVIVVIVVIIIIIVIMRKKKDPQEQAGPDYSELKPVPTDVLLDMQENVAYGPIKHPIEMRDNIAYESVGH